MDDQIKREFDYIIDAFDLLPALTRRAAVNPFAYKDELLLYKSGPNQRRFDEIEAGICSWLKTLSIPALRDDDKLKASAKQLRKVLVEKLSLGPSE